MQHDYFTVVEQQSNNSLLALQEVVDHLVFNEQGLIPIITQDASTQSILMFAWMNKEALEKTILTRYMTYWSRSRKKMWVKGETSGHVQRMLSMSFDCDGDAVLCQVEQQGAACHTGRKSCFYLRVCLEEKAVQVEGTFQS